MVMLPYRENFSYIRTLNTDKVKKIYITKADILICNGNLKKCSSKNVEIL